MDWWHWPRIIHLHPTLYLFVGDKLVPESPLHLCLFAGCVGLVLHVSNIKEGENSSLTALRPPHVLLLLHAGNIQPT